MAVQTSSINDFRLWNKRAAIGQAFAYYAGPLGLRGLDSHINDPTFAYARRCQANGDTMLFQRHTPEFTVYYAVRVHPVIRYRVEVFARKFKIVKRKRKR